MTKMKAKEQLCLDLFINRDSGPAGNISVSDGLVTEAIQLEEMRNERYRKELVNALRMSGILDLNNSH